ncbi:hypothetical protein KEM60_01231 [Austwickia sp. TVS 96-490-7B]|nr:hypothetical protein [Austwickia sp. TVS 96-490-7B]
MSDMSRDEEVEEWRMQFRWGAARGLVISCTIGGILSMAACLVGFILGYLFVGYIFGGLSALCFGTLLAYKVSQGR